MASPLYINKRISYVPEYEQTIRELLFTYDQVAQDYLFREVLEIIGHMPSETKILFLVSPARKEELNNRIGELELKSCGVIEADDPDLAGDWARDIFLIAWENGKIQISVPYNKSALKTSDLVRGFRVLRRLETKNRSVRQIPLCVEGGNIFHTWLDDKRTLLVGNTALLETQEIYRIIFGKSLTEKEVQNLFCQSCHVDQTIFLGRRKEGKPQRQSELLFHLDMTMVPLSRQTVGVMEFNLKKEEIPELEDDIQAQHENLEQAREMIREMEENTTDTIMLKKISQTDPRKGSRLTADEEWNRLQEAREESEAIRCELQRLGYRTEPVPTHWRHVRRFQAFTNIIQDRDRILMPIFPTRERLAGHMIQEKDERGKVQVYLSPWDNTYSLTGFNLQNFNLYRKFRKDVRLIRDHFYLAGGNIHCITGVLS